jgi:hypothetical protein
MAGLPWALKLNLMRGGLKCSIAFSHAWDDGIFEVTSRA